MLVEAIYTQHTLLPLCLLRLRRFGAKALKRAARAGEVTAAEVAADLFTRCGPGSFKTSAGSSLAATAAAAAESSDELVAALGAAGSPVDLLAAAPTVADMLYAFGAPGLAVRLRRSAAVTVNPWLIVVEAVSARSCRGCPLKMTTF